MTNSEIRVERGYGFDSNKYIYLCVAGNFESVIIGNSKMDATMTLLRAIKIILFNKIIERI